MYARGEPSGLNNTRSARQVTLNPVAFAAARQVTLCPVASVVPLASRKDPYESFAGEMATSNSRTIESKTSSGVSASPE